MLSFIDRILLIYLKLPFLAFMSISISVRSF